MIPDIAELLRSIRRDGSVLPAVPVGWTGKDIHRRTDDEVHDCLICGGRAHMAYVAHTKSGHRWLDLCMPCSSEVRRVAARPEYQPGWTPGKRTHEPPAS